MPAPFAAARERLIARLTESFARDELSVEEFARRLTVAYDASTVEDLASLVAGLPVKDQRRPGIVRVPAEWDGRHFSDSAWNHARGPTRGAYRAAKRVGRAELGYSRPSSAPVYEPRQACT